MSTIGQEPFGSHNHIGIHRELLYSCMLSVILHHHPGTTLYLLFQLPSSTSYSCTAFLCIKTWLKSTLPWQNILLLHLVKPCSAPECCFEEPLRSKAAQWAPDRPSQSVGFSIEILLCEMLPCQVSFLHQDKVL